MKRFFHWNSVIHNYNYPDANLYILTYNNNNYDRDSFLIIDDAMFERNNSRKKGITFKSL